MPNQPLALHRHEHGRALISLNGGQLHVDADPAGTQHADVNETNKPIEVIVVELKNDR